jgi:GntR family transcriptional regulator/MocR family aminotransferase
MRVRYRARRDALVETLVDALPEVRVHGIRAGLHVTVQLLPGDRGRAIRDEAARRGVALTPMSDYYLDPAEDSSMLLLGYGRSSEAVIRAGVTELASAVRAVRASREPALEGVSTALVRFQ